MTEKTFFAPPERQEREEALAESRSLTSYPDLSLLMQAVPECAAILNGDRQILLANEELLRLLGVGDVEDVVSIRPGEALGCVHGAEMPGGCGTSESCRYCGAANAIVEALETNSKTTRECRITAGSGNEEGWLDLKVTAFPIDCQGRRLLLLTLADISDYKRRRNLEKIFFHDILNSAAALHGLIELMQELDEEEVREELPALMGLSDRLIEEISAQRDLTAAESGELQVREEEFDVRALVNDAVALFGRGKLAKGRELLARVSPGAIEVVTDQRLMFRIITNMLKNALEATPKGGTVTAGVDAAPGGGARIWVRNTGSMPREVQLQVFQRSFSTKGAGRGLGTYSMKLIGERYLGGRVSFTTDEESGTEFSMTLPPGAGAQG